MVDKHDWSSFGQKSAVMVSTNTMSEPHVFFRCIKKKDDGSWEKPSQKEGKITKFGLSEIAAMIKVLSKEKAEWQGFHDFNGEKTAIKINWSGQNNDVVYLVIGNYRKQFGEDEAEVLRALLRHIFKEKIAHATISKQINKNNNNKTRVVQEVVRPAPETEPLKMERVQMEPQEPARNVSNNKKNDDQTNISGVVNGSTEKALLILFDNGKEGWVPRSTVHSAYDDSKNSHNKFLIDTWILKNNNIM